MHEETGWMRSDSFLPDRGSCFASVAADGKKEKERKIQQEGFVIGISYERWGSNRIPAIIYYY